MTSFIPFFVADRPMSLFILKTSGFQKLNLPMGIMTHAVTSSRFKKLFKEYPCDTSATCPLSSNCKYPKQICKNGQKIKDLTIKMVDSGAFHKKGGFESYEKLFSTYEEMGTDFGVIYDYLRDEKKTVESARKAFNVYQKGNYHFNLVGVTQGKNVSQYLNCYEKLKNLGYNYIAIGGLLNKNLKTIRFASLKEDFMVEVISEIRKNYPDDWLFALGCNNHNRIETFQSNDLNIYGSDSKGWIFKYKKTEKQLSADEARLKRISQVHSYIINSVYSRISSP
ncbi:MAG: hypothetical protein ACTSP3_03435 [Candidatus Heimdallarchaeaceae archaeon]